MRAARSRTPWASVLSDQRNFNTAVRDRQRPPYKVLFLASSKISIMRIMCDGLKVTALLRICVSGVVEGKYLNFNLPRQLEGVYSA